MQEDKTVMDHLELPRSKEPLLLTPTRAQLKAMPQLLIHTRGLTLGQSVPLLPIPTQVHPRPVLDHTQVQLNLVHLLLALVIPMALQGLLLHLLEQVILTEHQELLLLQPLEIPMEPLELQQ